MQTFFLAVLLLMYAFPGAFMVAVFAISASGACLIGVLRERRNSSEQLKA